MFIVDSSNDLLIYLKNANQKLKFHFSDNHLDCFSVENSNWRLHIAICRSGCWCDNWFFECLNRISRFLCQSTHIFVSSQAHYYWAVCISFFCLVFVHELKKNPFHDLLALWFHFGFCIHFWMSFSSAFFLCAFLFLLFCMIWS